MSIEKTRLALLIDPPPWKYDPETGTLTNKWNKVLVQTRYNGVYYNPTAIRVWLATGYYPEKTYPLFTKNTRKLPNGMPDGGPRDYRLCNIGYDYETK